MESCRVLLIAKSLNAVASECLCDASRACGSIYEPINLGNGTHTMHQSRGTSYRLKFGSNDTEVNILYRYRIVEIIPGCHLQMKSPYDLFNYPGAFASDSSSVSTVNHTRVIPSIQVGRLALYHSSKKDPSRVEKLDIVRAESIIMHEVEIQKRQIRIKRTLEEMRDNSNSFAMLVQMAESLSFWALFEMATDGLFTWLFILMVFLSIRRGYWSLFLGPSIHVMTSPVDALNLNPLSYLPDESSGFLCVSSFKHMQLLSKVCLISALFFLFLFKTSSSTGSSCPTSPVSLRHTVSSTRNLDSSLNCRWSSTVTHFGRRRNSLSRSGFHTTTVCLMTQ